MNIRNLQTLFMAVLYIMLPSATFADNVAKIGTTEYGTLADAFAAAAEGETVSITAAGTYSLSSLTTNITVAGSVDGVVFNCEGTGNIAAIPNGATFQNVTFNMGQQNYHGFQHPSVINMENCTLNGKFFSYGDMNFTNCSFIQSSSDYHMWIYGAGTVTFKDCTFTNNAGGKFLHLYSESSANVAKVLVSGCKFINNGSSSKAAINVKATSGSTDLNYTLTVVDSSVEGNFPEIGEKDNSDNTYVLNQLVQVDDRKLKANTDEDITVSIVTTDDETGATNVSPYSAGTKDDDFTAAAKVGELYYYENLEDAVSGASSDDLVTLLQDVASITVSNNVTIDTNGHSLGEIIAEGDATIVVDGNTIYENGQKMTIEISTIEELKAFRDAVNNQTSYAGKTVILTADLDLSSEANWEPIGTNSMGSYPGKAFKGTFDGNGHTISNLTVSTSAPNYATAGFFGSIETGTIKNLTLQNVDIQSTHYAGAVVAYTSNTPTIENCHVIDGTITSTPELVGTSYDNGDKVGGIMGYATAGTTITRCSVDGVTITAYRDIAGIVGFIAAGSSVTECAVTDVTIIQDNTNGYKTEDQSATASEVVGGRSGAGVASNNTTDNVTVTSVSAAVILADGEPYTNNEDKLVSSATYKRSFGSERVDKFQAWFVPFDYTITDDDADMFSFYKINMIANSAEPGESGEDTDKFWIFLVAKQAGELLAANEPYVFKPKAEAQDYTFTTENATLKAIDNTSRLNCSTTSNNYDFYGVYSNTSPSSETPFYYMNIYGSVSLGNLNTVTVGPYRWIIKVTDKSGSLTSSYARQLNFIVTDDLTTTAISHAQKNTTEVSVFTLDGKRVSRPAKGLHIVRTADGLVRKVNF